MPMGCRSSNTFLVDTSCLENAEDIRADDNGKFRHNGRKLDIFAVNDEGEVEQLEEKPKSLQPDHYKLYRSYWSHTSNSNFKRRFTELEDYQGHKFPVVILQYKYDGDPEDIKVEPHKSAKKTPKPFYSTAKSTREKIAKKATSALGPTSIYDDLYEDAGGVIEKSASCTVPRGISQVKYERAKLRKKHNKDALAELIEKCKDSKGEFVHGLQVGPSVRVALASKSQLEDVVKFCCNPEEFSIFGVDVTYEIGDFFVTTTSYKHLMVIDKETGCHLTFPGPFMIHTNESADDFHYFASTLKERNRDIENILFVGSDRQKAIENGISAQLPIAHFLACSKHVEDNITRKMALLNISGEAKSEILADIFGERRCSTKGLIDSESDEEFDAKLMSLKEQWDDAETRSSRCKTPEFYTYFLHHIASDMKAKMMLPVRRLAQLGDDFYYNNGPESINSALKKEIDKQKRESSPGRPSKCSYVEFIEIAENFVGRYRRNVHRAVKGDGPYTLAPKFSHLEVTEEQWKRLTPEEKVSKISAVDKAGAKSYGVREAGDPKQASEASVCEDEKRCLPDFHCSGLPQDLKVTWQNAETILKTGGVTKVSGAEATFAVISLSNPSRPHIVNCVRNPKCDCECYRLKQICSHYIAVSSVQHTLEETLSDWIPNLSRLMQDSIPKRSGKKPGPRRIRPTRAPEKRDTSILEDRCKGVEPFPEAEKFHLKWLEGSRVTTCYGCGNKIRQTTHDPVPPDPYDVVICRKQVRAYTPRGTSGLRFTVKPENVFFHVRRACIAMQCSDPVSAKNLVISDEDRLRLKITHRNMLRKEFGLDL